MSKVILKRNNIDHKYHDYIMITNNQCETFMFYKYDINRIKIIKLNNNNNNNHDHYTISPQLTKNLQQVFSNLIQYKRNNTYNRFNATIKKITKHAKIKYVLLIIDILDQIIYKILIDHNQSKVISITHCDVIFDGITTDDHQYLLILQIFCRQDNKDKNVYGIALNFKNYTYYNVKFSNWMDTDCEISNIKVSMLNEYRTFRSHAQFNSYYIKYHVGKNAKFLLVWKNIFEMKLITFTHNKFIIDYIDVKPKYSDDQLLELTKSPHGFCSALDYTTKNKCIFFIPPLDNNNFFIGFIDFQIYKVSLYYVKSKQTIECRNNDLLKEFKQNIQYNKHSYSLQVNIFQTNDNINKKIIISGFLHVIIKEFKQNIQYNDNHIPQILIYIISKYYCPQIMCIQDCYSSCRFSFNVDELFTNILFSL